MVDYTLRYADMRRKVIMREKITIERLAYGDAGVGKCSDGRIAFVDGTCPGDVVEISTREDKGRFVTADLLGIEEASSHRVSPACPFADSCGGCGWQHISYETQVNAKREAVISQLIRTARIEAGAAEALVDACVGSKKTLGYRNKIELAGTWDRTHGYRLGFHGKKSAELISPDTCPLAHPSLKKAPKSLRGALRYLQGSNDLGIFRVGIRHSERTGSCEVALWTKPGAFPRKEVAKTLESALKTSSVVRVMTADDGHARKLKGVEALSGKGFWEETVAGTTFKVSAPSFFQVNTAQADMLVKLALDALSIRKDETVADLYCGIGTFTIPLAQACDYVIGVESYGSSVRDLRRIAQSKQLDIEIIGGDAARELPEIGELDALLVDPPRSGLASEIIGSIVQAAPSRMVYVSCNPSTWARDVLRLHEAGFELVKATPVDMFPQTYHTEVVSLFVNTRG